MTRDWRPSAAPGVLRLRARLNAYVRDFFAARGVLEVETPVLSAAGNTEPNIDGFHAGFSGHVDAGARRRWLRTSPEYALKRLLAAGLGDCYELGRVFRNGEAGGRHNPEFTLLEWYRVGWDHRRLIGETIELVQGALALAAAGGPSVQRSAGSKGPLGGSVRLAPECSVHETTYRALFLDALGLDPFAATIEALRAPLAEFGIAGDGLRRDDWLDLLFTHRLQPAFPADRITVVVDWPASQCALARIRRDDPPVAERYELYLGRYELANGYHELTDADEQAQRFEADLDRRRRRGDDALPPVDERLLAALRAGLPACAGVALGMDRLLMAMLGTDRIADVLAFDFARA